jgi:hypothetical protein
VEQLQDVRSGDKPGTVAGLELRQQVADVVRDRLTTNEEAGRDVARLKAHRHQLQNPRFPVGEMWSDPWKTMLPAAQPTPSSRFRSPEGRVRRRKPDYIGRFHVEAHKPDRASTTFI